MYTPPAGFKFWFRTWYGADLYRKVEPNGDIKVQEVQNLEPFIEHNKALANSGDTGWNKDKSIRRAASIPLSLLDQWKSEGLDIHDRNNEKIVKRLLNDSDYRDLRTAHWRV